MKIRYQGPLVAPIAKGQEVAQLVITTGDTPPQVVPLVAGEEVGKAGFFGRSGPGSSSSSGWREPGQVHQRSKAGRGPASRRR